MGINTGRPNRERTLGLYGSEKRAITRACARLLPLCFLGTLFPKLSSIIEHYVPVYDGTRTRAHHKVLPSLALSVIHCGAMSKQLLFRLMNVFLCADIDGK